MFKDEATKKAFNWNLKRCKSAKRMLRQVKKDLLYKAKRFEYHDEDGTVECWTHERLSREGFDELKKLCQEEGIVFSSEWESPFPALYCFSMKVR